MISRESDDRELSRQECLSLLTTEPYGRLVHPAAGEHRPAIPGPSPLPTVPAPA